jgi:ribosomal protein S18 acetylase RimI-like enzyme
METIPSPLSHYRYKHLEKSDIPSLIEISDATLGKGFITKETMEIGTSKKDQFFVKVACDASGNIVAFSIVLIVSNQDLHFLLNEFQFSSLPDTIISKNKIGIIKTIGVQPQHQKRGIGSAFLRIALQYFEENSVEIACAFAWKKGDKVGMNGIFDRHQFAVVLRIPDFWAYDSLQKNYYCQECGLPPCSCSSVVYTRKLPNK